MRRIGVYRIFLALLLGFAALQTMPAATADDVADVPGADVTVGKDKHKRYFRIGPKKGIKTPKKGFALAVILPGGGGGADFHAFCKRIVKHALPDDFIAVQPVAVKWTKGQQIVWPTAKSKVKKMKFTTEAFVDAVIADAGTWQKIDPKRIYVICWSSSGPAAYALSLTKRSKPSGYFIAMSVFHPNSLPKLSAAKGKAYYLYHSPDDRVCPHRMAKDAERTLTKKGAKVQFKEYAGGHGWRGPMYPDIRGGIAWLEKNASK